MDLIRDSEQREQTIVFSILKKSVWLGNSNDSLAFNVWFLKQIKTWDAFPFNSAIQN